MKECPRSHSLETDSEGELHEDMSWRVSLGAGSQKAGMGQEKWVHHAGVAQAPDDPTGALKPESAQIKGNRLNLVSQPQPVTGSRLA